MEGAAKPTLFAADALLGVGDGFRFGAGALAPIIERAEQLWSQWTAKSARAKFTG